MLRAGSPIGSSASASPVYGGLKLALERRRDGRGCGCSPWGNELVVVGFSFLYFVIEVVGEEALGRLVRGWIDLPWTW